MDKTLNIGWYARGGHLQLFPRISKKLKVDRIKVQPHYVCHTKAEKIKLVDEYGIQPWVLGDFIDDSTFKDVTKDYVTQLEKKYQIRLRIMES